MTATQATAIKPESLRVLLFEDNALDAALIKKFLQTAGVRQANIHLTDTIPSALQLLTRDSVDVCLVDYYLRPHTGLDLMDEARRFDVDVPFIMLTSMDDRSIDDGALARRAYGFLVKGDLTVEGLERTIRYAMKRHVRERALVQAAAFDDMTGLPNRATFLERLAQDIDDHRPKGGMLSLLLINMHATRFLNEAYGPAVGDDVLKTLAERLRAHRRSSDYIGRLGGDTFGVILSDVVLQHHAQIYAKKLMGVVAQPAETRDGVHDIVVACGLASHTTKTDGVATADIVTGLLRRATEAMTEAKKNTRNKAISELIAAKLH